MRITHVIQTLDPATGGPAAVAARLAAAQAALGHQTAIASYADDAHRGCIEESLASVPGINRCERIALGAATGMEGWIAQRGITALRQSMRQRPDVLHLHGVWEPILLRAARLARKLGVPYVVRPCGMLDPWSLRQHSLKKRLALTLAYRTMLNSAAFLHALNPDEARLIEPLSLRCPVRIIPNGVFLDEVRPLPPIGEFRADVMAGAKTGLAVGTTASPIGEKPFVLFLSRLHRKKGLDILADAFAIVAREMPEVQLVVAGPDQGAGAEFRERVAAAGLTPRVHLIGPLYGRQKLAALVDATCFVLPSRQEGFSVAILEALACGTPVVISDACHFPEVSEHGAGRVTSLDPSAIASALLELLRDEPMRRRMGAAGTMMVEASYTWPRIAERTIAAYQARE